MIVTKMHILPGVPAGVTIEYQSEETLYALKHFTESFAANHTIVITMSAFDLCLLNADRMYII